MSWRNRSEFRLLDASHGDKEHNGLSPCFLSMPKEPHTIPKEPPVTEPPVKDPQPYKDPPPQPLPPEPGPDVPLTDPKPPAPTM
jgi:hypothetical protein